MGGTPKRMEQFAYFIMDEIGHKLPAGTTLLDISQYSYRYSMYKVGPVLSISVRISRRVETRYAYSFPNFMVARNGYSISWHPFA